MKPPIISDNKWTDRDKSENIFDLELGVVCHSLWNVSSANQRRDTIISFCNSEPNFGNNTEDLVVTDASEAAAHLTIEQEVPGCYALYQYKSKSVENNSMNIYPRNGHSSSPTLIILTTTDTGREWVGESLRMKTLSMMTWHVNVI